VLEYQLGSLSIVHLSALVYISRCGNTPPPLASQDPTDLLCNMACPGDPNDRCGATGYISVFYDPTKYVAGTDPSLYGPQTVKAAGNYLYQGCYSESTNGRALAALSPPAPPGGFTIELCQVACQGYLYFGMEYSNQVSAFLEYLQRG
jgi:hypothetical protein